MRPPRQASRNSLQEPKATRAGRDVLTQPSVDRAERYLSELARELPGVRVVDKAGSRLCRLLDVALRVVTLGRQSAFMTRYVTTIGKTIYVPEGWAERSEADRYATLRHEAVHLRQFRRYGRLGTSLLYLLPILPMGLALGRARLEQEAYAETLRATAEVGGLEAAERLREHVVRQFVSGAYGWMWPFPGAIHRWLDRTLEEIRLEQNPGSV